MTSQTSMAYAGTARDVPALPERLSGLHKISWGSIIAGVAVALVVQLLLSILGLGIGLATVDPASSGTPSAASLSIGAAVWWVVSGVIASAIGGFVSGRLSGKPTPATAGYHGLVTWSVTTLVVVFLLSSTIGGILGGAFGAVTSTLGGAGHLIGGAVQTAAPSLPGMNDPLSGIESQIKSASGGQDPAQLRDAAANAVKAALTGDPSQQQQASDRAAEALAKAQGIPVDQAKAQIQQYQKQYSDAMAQAKAKAIEIADASAKATSKAAMMIVLALVLGALAAFFGGRAGTVRPLAFDDVGERTAR